MQSIQAKPYSFTFDPKKCAFLFIDYQGDFESNDGLLAAQGAPVGQLRKSLPTSVQGLKAARAAGLHIFHTREGHVSDLSDCPTPKRTRQVNAPNGSPATIGSVGINGDRGLVRGEKTHDILNDMKPIPGEIVIDKPGKGAFYNTELHQLLVNRQVSHIFVAGWTTECCVATTFREANDRGFDCCLVTDMVAGYRQDYADASIGMASYADGLFGYSCDSEALLPALAAVAKAMVTPPAWNGDLDIATLSSLYKAGTLTPETVIEEVYRRIALPEADPAVWLHLLDKETVLKEAKELLMTYPNPATRPPLFGIPYSIKDSIDYAGTPTTGACPAYAFMPEKDAPSVTMLKAAGALAIGKVNLGTTLALRSSHIVETDVFRVDIADQLATGLVGMRSPYGQPASVFSKEYVSGGSSSGSCVSVAAHQVTFSLATDTAGSGRVPAAFNGIIGYKPTRGTIPAEGVVPCCLSLDCIAIEALKIEDVHRVWDSLYLVDETEAFAKVARPPWALAPRAVLQPKENFTFASPGRNTESRKLVSDEFNDLFDAALERVAKIGGKPCSTLDYTVFEDAGRLLYEGSFVAERVSGVKDWYNAHPKPTDGKEDALLPEIRTIYDAAAKGFSGVDVWGDVRKQMLSQRLATKEFKKGFQVLIVPTVPLHPTKEAYLADPIGLNHKLGKFTHYANILDMTGVSVPAGFTKTGMPFAITILGLSFTDGLVLEIAKRFEESFNIPSGAPRKYLRS